MNVAGHRISTIEVESALVDHPAVAEAAVVGKHDAVTGEAIFAFVTTRAGVQADDELAAELRAHVGSRHRRHRPASLPRLHARPAQDALRQDHAPAAPRRGRGSLAG